MQENIKMALFLLSVWTEASKLRIIDVNYIHTVEQGARFAKMMVQDKACDRPDEVDWPIEE